MHFRRHVCLLGLAASLMGCADVIGPHQRTISGDFKPNLLLGDADAPPPDEDVPEEFYTSSSIISTTLDVGFEPGGGYGIATVRYYANRAKVNVNLDLRLDNELVYSTTGEEEAQHFLPATRELWAPAYMSVSGDCGYALDGRARYEVWHQFPGKWRIYSWGLRTSTAHKPKQQPSCSPPPSSGGGGGAIDEPGGGCERCQQWFIVFNGIIIDEYWECEPIDESICQSLGIGVAT